jgi:hypothetical protein
MTLLERRTACSKRWLRCAASTFVPHARLSLQPLFPAAMQFMSFSKRVCASLSAAGYWADYADPCSGLPVHTPSNTIYGEVDGTALLFRYRVCLKAPHIVVD